MFQHLRWCENGFSPPSRIFNEKKNHFAFPLSFAFIEIDLLCKVLVIQLYSLMILSIFLAPLFSIFSFIHLNTLLFFHLRTFFCVCICTWSFSFPFTIFYWFFNKKKIRLDFHLRSCFDKVWSYWRYIFIYSSLHCQ